MLECWGIEHVEHKRNDDYSNWVLTTLLPDHHQVGPRTVGKTNI